MEVKSNDFFIMSVNYKRPHLLKNNTKSNLKVTEGCQIALMSDNQNNHRIQIDVTLTAVILRNVTKKEEEEELMLELKTRSTYDVDKEPNSNELEPYISDAVIESREALKKITVTINISPIDLIDNPIRFK